MTLQGQQLKEKVSEIFQVCQDELKRTTEIGKRMLSASKTNTTLHSSYEEIGILVVKAIQSGDLKWDNARVKELLATINLCESDLNDIEKEVHDIKAQSAQEES